MRHTRSHTRNRRSHHALVAGAVVTDKESGALRLPHRLDESTGMYRGKLIVPERKKEVKEEKKRRAKNQEEESATTAPGHTHEAPVAEEREKKQGLVGRMQLGKAKSRSGMGGQAGS